MAVEPLCAAGVPSGVCTEASQQRFARPCVASWHVSAHASLVALGLITLLLHLAGGDSPWVGLAARERSSFGGYWLSPWCQDVLLPGDGCQGCKTLLVAFAAANRATWWLEKAPAPAPSCVVLSVLGCPCCWHAAARPSVGRQHPLGILAQGRGTSGCRKGKEELGRTRTVSSCGSVSGKLHLVARLVLKLLRSWEWRNEHPLHPSCPAGLRPL